MKHVDAADMMGLLGSVCLLVGLWGWFGPWVAVTILGAGLVVFAYLFATRRG